MYNFNSNSLISFNTNSNLYSASLNNINSSAEKVKAEKEKAEKEKVKAEKEKVKELKEKVNMSVTKIDKISKTTKKVNVLQLKQGKHNFYELSKIYKCKVNEYIRRLKGLLEEEARIRKSLKTEIDQFEKENSHVRALTNKLLKSN